MERRDQILDAARDLFLEEGLKGVSMRRVATQVGITAPAIYRHFKDKADLIAHVVEEGFTIFARYLFGGLKGADPLDRLRLTGQRYFDFGFEESRYYRVIFMSWDQLDPRRHVAQHHAEGYGPTFLFLIDRVRECLDAGLLRPSLEPLQVSLLLWAVCHGLVSLYLAGGARGQIPLPQFRVMCDALVEQVIGGLRP